MKNLMLNVVIVAIVVAVMVFVVLKLLGLDNPSVIAGGAAGGVIGAIIGYYTKKKKATEVELESDPE